MAGPNQDSPALAADAQERKDRAAAGEFPMLTVWKFRLQLGGYARPMMPIGASIVHVGLDPESGDVALWALVNTGVQLTQRHFIVHGTGREVDAGEVHIGSVIDGPNVWHAFERVSLPAAWLLDEAAR